MNPTSSWTLITGASKGLGFALATEFARLGRNLILLARDNAKLDDVKIHLEEAYGIRVLTFTADVSDRLSITDVCNRIKQSIDKLDILVNNVGLFKPDSLFSENEEIENLISSNLYSAYYMTRGLIDLLLHEDRAHIINICSTAGLQAYPNGASYSISKYALRGFSINLREELKDSNVAVTTVYPGAFYSESWKESGISEDSMMSATDVAKSVASVTLLSGQSVVEELILRPQKGDI